MAVVIGIGGASRAGKSTLAKKLKECMATKRVTHLDMDDFVHPEQKLPTIRDRHDWDHPDTYDLDRLLKKIAQLQASSDIILVEGMFALYYPALIDLYQLRVFVDIDRDTFLFRRQQETRWGTEPDWYIRHAWESFKKWGQQPHDIRISGKDGIKSEAFSAVMARILLLTA